MGGQEDGAFARVEKRFAVLEKKLDFLADHVGLSGRERDHLHEDAELTAVAPTRRSLRSKPEPRNDESSVPFLTQTIDDLANMVDYTSHLAAYLESIATRHFGEPEEGDAPGYPSPGAEGAVWDIERQRIHLRAQLMRLERVAQRLGQL